MSTVRISNGSPTLERVDAPQTDYKPPVRRNLFPSDNRNREELKRESDGEMRDAARAFVERWNYDIINDRPLSPGNCEWKAMRSSEVPAFYSKPPRKRRYPARELDVNGKDCQQNCGVTGSLSSKDTERTADRTGCSSPINRSRMCPDPDLQSPKRSRYSYGHGSESETESDNCCVRDREEDAQEGGRQNGT